MRTPVRNGRVKLQSITRNQTSRTLKMNRSTQKACWFRRCHHGVPEFLLLGFTGWSGPCGAGRALWGRGGITYLWLARNEGIDPHSSPHITQYSSLHLLFHYSQLTRGKFKGRHEILSSYQARVSFISFYARLFKEASQDFCCLCAFGRVDLFCFLQTY